MKIARLRSIGFAVLLVLLAGADCNRSKRALSGSSPAPTPHGSRGSITAHAHFSYGSNRIARQQSAGSCVEEREMPGRMAGRAHRPQGTDHVSRLEQRVGHRSHLLESG